MAAEMVAADWGNRSVLGYRESGECERGVGKVLGMERECGGGVGEDGGHEVNLGLWISDFGWGIWEERSSIVKDGQE